MGHNELFSEVLEIFFPKSVSYVRKPVRAQAKDPEQHATWDNQGTSLQQHRSGLRPALQKGARPQMSHDPHPALGSLSLQLLGEPLLPSPGDVVFEATGDRPASLGQSRMPRKDAGEHLWTCRTLFGFSV